MSELDIYEFVTEIKDAFGSCKILDDLDPIEDIPNIYKFAKIVNNYKKMSNLLAETTN
ncbi:MAG: hypothetical protein WC979_03025 [Candidatus Pacearchaeota archaeon]|jgi:hypothetical protein|nr:hypothetical protein [Clostridia bacterium]